MNDRFNFRVAIRQKDGTYKRYGVISLGWDARGLYARVAIPHKENEFYLHDIVIDGENAILEQCTGLKDKNGKLIFEGDIVMCQVPGAYYSVKAVVEFVTPGGNIAEWRCRYLDYFHRIYTSKAISGCTAQELRANACEIIGNIHEKEGE